MGRRVYLFPVCLSSMVNGWVTTFPCCVFDEFYIHLRLTHIIISLVLPWTQSVQRCRRTGVNWLCKKKRESKNVLYVFTPWLHFQIWCRRCCCSLSLHGARGLHRALWCSSLLEHDSINDSVMRLWLQQRAEDLNLSSVLITHQFGWIIRQEPVTLACVQCTVSSLWTQINSREKLWCVFQKGQRLKVLTPPSVFTAGSLSEKISVCVHQTECVSSLVGYFINKVVSVLAHLQYFVAKIGKIFAKNKVISIIVKWSFYVNC